MRISSAHVEAEVSPTPNVTTNHRGSLAHGSGWARCSSGQVHASSAIHEPRSSFRTNSPLRAIPPRQTVRHESPRSCRTVSWAGRPGFMIIHAIAASPGRRRDRSLCMTSKPLRNGPRPQTVSRRTESLVASVAQHHQAISAHQSQLLNAIVELDTAAHQAPNDLSYRLDLAILYDHAGYAPQAVELYKQVLQSGTSLPISSQTLEQRVEYLESLNNSQSKVNAPESSAR